MKLLIVILNYQTPDLTVACLNALEKQVRSLSDTHVQVIDNDSQDESTRKIQSAIKFNEWSPWVSFRQLDDNKGFASGNNAVLQEALQSENPPDYFLILNPDTLVKPGALSALAQFMDQNPSVGIAGSRLENSDGSPQHSACRFHTILSELDSGLRLGFVTRLLSQWVVAPHPPQIPTRTDWVMGACMMIRRTVLEEIGLFDEKYFLYFEEVDLCLRAERAGWSSWYVPQSRVFHFGGKVSDTAQTDSHLKHRPTSWFHSRQRYFLKNHGLFYAMGADAAWLVGFILWRVRRIIQRKPDQDPPKLLSNFLRFSIFVKRADI